VVKTIRVLKQRDWTEAELKAANFQYYAVRKRLVMAKMLKEAQDIEITLEVLSADEGDIICYNPGSVRLEHLEDYDHWPVRRDLFRENYRPWDEAGWLPNPAEEHLLLNGCRPFYKVVGVWAQYLTRALYVQSLESPRPVLVPPGRWLCVGVRGEPYHMNDEEFHNRYMLTPETS
jgi:hypothetical protein